MGKAPTIMLMFWKSCEKGHVIIVMRSQEREREKKREECSVFYFFKIIRRELCNVYMGMIFISTTLTNYCTTQHCGPLFYYGVNFLTEFLTGKTRVFDGK